MVIQIPLPAVAIDIGHEVGILRLLNIITEALNSMSTSDPFFILSTSLRPTLILPRTAVISGRPGVPLRFIVKLLFRHLNDGGFGRQKPRFSGTDVVGKFVVPFSNLAGIDVAIGVVLFQVRAVATAGFGGTAEVLEGVGGEAAGDFVGYCGMGGHGGVWKSSVCGPRVYSRHVAGKGEKYGDAMRTRKRETEADI